MSLFERRQQPLVSSRVFVRRVFRYLGFSAAILLASLAIGIVGYHSFEGLSWVDSLLNASMILGGMGPVTPLQTEGGKIFASFYALFSGVIFLVAVGVLVAPVFHRFLHSFHLDIDEEKESQSDV